MAESRTNLNKNKKITLLFVFTMFFLLIVGCFIVDNAKAISYTPASPSGPTSGFNNTEYEYVMNNIKSGSNWKFDWGDGSYSNWIEAGTSDNFVNQTHSWSQPGIYNVRIKHRSKYMEESTWSSPLVVNISISSGSDSSPTDDSETVDVDSDNDGLSDIIEEKLNSNPEDKSDVISINIDGTTHFLVDTNSYGGVDTFYNVFTNSSTKIEMNADGTCWIKMDVNNNWEYIYSFVDGTVKPYDVKSESSFEFPWLTALITIAIVVFIVLFILFKTGILFVYEEEYEVEE